MNLPTKDELGAQLVGCFAGEGKNIEDLQDAWFIKHLLLAVREVMYGIMTVVKSMYTSLFALTATDSELDKRGGEFGVFRKEATYAYHRVTISNKSKLQADTEVPDGMLVSTRAQGGKKAIKFSVVPGQGKIIGKGMYSIMVETVCTEPGRVGNVANGAIELVCDNRFDSCGYSQLIKNAEDREDDEAYRERILAAKRSVNMNGTVSDWERWAMTYPGTTSAKVIARANGAGTLAVHVTHDGQLPSESFLKGLKNYLVENYLPADMDESSLVCMAPVKQVVNITVLECETPLDMNAAASAVYNQLGPLFEKINKQRVCKLIDIIVFLAGVPNVDNMPLLKNFVLTEPTADIILEPDKVFAPGLFKLGKVS